MAYVYILRCADGSLYVGSTCNLTERIFWHNEGRGSRFTASRRPVVLAFSEPHATMRSAARRERQIKRWTRGKKEALLAGDYARLKAL